MSGAVIHSPYAPPYCIGTHVPIIRVNSRCHLSGNFLYTFIPLSSTLFSPLFLSNLCVCVWGGGGGGWPFLLPRFFPPHIFFNTVFSPFSSFFPLVRGCVCVWGGVGGGLSSCPVSSPHTFTLKQCSHLLFIPYPFNIFNSFLFSCLFCLSHLP